MRRHRGPQAYKLIIPRATGPAEPHPQRHEGYEWLYVLNGTLRFVLGDQELVLAPGEVAEFDTHVPHCLGNAGPTGRIAHPVRAPGGTPHVRAWPRPKGA